MTATTPFTSWILRRDARGGMSLLAIDHQGDERLLASTMDKATALASLPATAQPIGRHPHLDHPDILDAWVSDIAGLHLLDRESLTD